MTNYTQRNLIRDSSFPSKQLSLIDLHNNRKICIWARITNPADSPRKPSKLEREVKSWRSSSLSGLGLIALRAFRGQTDGSLVGGHHHFTHRFRLIKPYTTRVSPQPRFAWFGINNSQNVKGNSNGVYFHERIVTGIVSSWLLSQELRNGWWWAGSSNDRGFRGSP